MSRKFCPRCGGESNGLCMECFLEMNPVQLNEIKLGVCNCGRYKYHGNWTSEMRAFLLKLVGKNILINPKIDIRKVDIEPEFRKKEILLRIKLTCSMDKKKFTRKLDGKIKLSQEICPLCSRAISGYYEAILQFRPAELMNKVKIDPEFISKAERLRGGVDIYLTSIEYAKKIAKKLTEKGLTVGESPKLVGKRGGKDAYRVSFSIKTK